MRWYGSVPIHIYAAVRGIECSPVPGEFAYGLERLAMIIQGIDNVYDIKWNSKGVTYGDIFLRNEKDYSAYNFEHANVEMLTQHFTDHEAECIALASAKLAQPAYDQCLKAAHIFNLLDARGVISVTERVAYINRIRNLARQCCQVWLDIQA